MNEALRLADECFIILFREGPLRAAKAMRRSASPRRATKIREAMRRICRVITFEIRLIGRLVWRTHLACVKGGLKAQCYDSPGQRPGLSKSDALRPVRAKDLFSSYHSKPGPIEVFCPYRATSLIS